MAVVGGGDLDHPIQATSRDEIGDLARALAAMTGQLRASREQLVQAEKLASIGEMSAAVAHGLRNPLASLRAAAQLVRRHPTSPGATEHLDAIIEEVDRLDRRISHLLSFSRPAPFHPVLREPAAADRRPAARRRDADSRAARRARDGGARRRCRRCGWIRCSSSRPSWRSCRTRSTPCPDGGRLRIGAYVANGDGPGAVVLEVSDTGGGIPEQALPSVCEPFFTTRQEGTGLGLAIAKRYVEQNGGRLEIASRAGRGHDGPGPAPHRAHRVRRAP